MHRISIVGNDPQAKLALEALGLSPKMDKPGINSWTYDTLNKNMAVLIERAEQICRVIDADIIFNARLGKNGSDINENKSLPFLPAASVRPGMVMFDDNGGYDVVERVEEIPLDAPVYDLDIEGTHNFIANGIVTHNSIYSWRGANPRVLLDFERDFPETQIVKLEQNYRSTQIILDAAQGVVRQNRIRKDKRLWTEKQGGEKITLHEATNEEEEASYVVNQLRTMVARHEIRYSDAAVMYRTNAQSRALEEQFVRTGTPYVVVGSKKFYERKEVKDVLAYLRLIANPLDTISLQRIINVPVRKIGPRTIAEFMSWAQEKELAPLEALALIEEHPTLATAGKRALANFYHLIADLRQLAQDEKLPFLIDRLLERSGYAAELRDGSDEGEERWNNVMELRRVAEDFSEIDPETALALFLENVALVAGADTTQTGEDGQLVNEESDAVTLITLHAAKGLEFPVVFLVGFEEGVLPHSRSLESQPELEEERRLAYVGITRAMNRLYLTRALRRTFFGGSAVYQEASRFLDEIPSELLIRSRDPHQSAKRFREDAEPGALRRERASLIWSPTPAAAPYRRETPRVPDAASRANSLFTPAILRPNTSEPDATTPHESSAPATGELHAGDHVMHRLFGEGTVLKVSEERGGVSVDVLFKSAGKKTLDPEFAKLERV